jgi:hypothetical protein
MFYPLLAVFVIPTAGIPFVYLTGKKSPKAAAILVALVALANIILISTTIPRFSVTQTTDTLNRTVGYRL